MKKVLAVTLGAIFALSLLASGAMAATTWNANSVWPPKNHHSQTLIQFAEKIKERTGGKLIIKVSTGGALGYKGPELLKVVRDGLVPVSDMLISGVAGDAKVFQIVTLPFLARDLPDARRLMKFARPVFDKTAAK